MANLVLTITNQETWLKTKPIDSQQLQSNEKLKVVIGQKFAPLNFEFAENQHVKFWVSKQSFLYAFTPHISLTQDGVDVLTPKPLVTADQFYAIAPQTSLDKLTPLVEPINQTLIKYEINTPLRICHFLAQICEESDQFNAVREYADGSEYEGWAELGNTQEGDGKRFLGRGLTMITGRSNYQDCGNGLGIDLIANPELLEEIPYSCLSAGWYWNTRNLNNLADQDRFHDITIAINGGENGIEARLANLQRAKQVFGI